MDVYLIYYWRESNYDTCTNETSIQRSITWQLGLGGWAICLTIFAWLFNAIIMDINR